MITPSTTDNTRQRLTMQMLGAEVCVTDALIAVRRLEPHLPVPNILSCVTLGLNDRPRSSLLQPPSQPQFKARPTALFKTCANLAAAELPAQWLEPFLEWAWQHQRWQQFEKCQASFRQAFAAGTPLERLPFTDAIVAGLLLYLLSPPPTSPLRQQLLALALTDPTGAYLAAEGHHTPDERPAIFEAMKGRSQLLFWASQLPPFAELALQPAKINFDLWSALTLVRHSVSPEELAPWLQKAAVAACDHPLAAVAALVLQPAAPKKYQALWLATLHQPAAAWSAFECLWWARQTWSLTDWQGLEKTLRQTILSDRGRAWFHYSLLEPELVYADYQRGETDPLWAIELLRQRHNERLPVDHRPLQNRMVERLVNAHGDPLATVVLHCLNQLKAGGAA